MKPDKESVIALQKIDCNCNDCKFMVRDMDKYSKSLELHNKWQSDYFNTIKSKLLARANEWKKLGDIDKYNHIVKSANSMKFQFDKSTALINYGYCSKLSKDVSFIPNVCQIDTQECFEHRRG